MKKVTSVLLSFIIFLSEFCSSVLAETQNFDTSGVSSGIIGIRYIPTGNQRVKVQIKNGPNKYVYDLFGRDNFEYFPLQMGAGNYQIVIYQNISGIRYRLVDKEKVKVEINNPPSVYLSSIQNINWDKDMAAVKKAAKLTYGLKTEKKKINAIYAFVVKTIKYDYDKINHIDSTYVPDIDQILESGKGICYDYASLFAAMLRSQGIPAKLIKGYSLYIKGYHAWNEVYLASEKQWIIIDTTYDSILKNTTKETPIMEKETSKYDKTSEY